MFLAQLKYLKKNSRFYFVQPKLKKKYTRGESSKLIGWPDGRTRTRTGDDVLSVTKQSI
jgi:hypothetical protein